MNIRFHSGGKSVECLGLRYYCSLVVELNKKGIVNVVNKLVNPFLSFQLYFENFLEKLAVDSIKMEADEYKNLREEHTQDWIIDELQERSFEKGLAAYNLRALRDALLRNQSIANRTFHEWQPPEV